MWLCNSGQGELIRGARFAESDRFRRYGEQKSLRASLLLQVAIENKNTLSPFLFFFSSGK